MVSVVSSLSLRSANAQDVMFLTDLRNRLARHFISPVPATHIQTAKLLETSNTYVIERDCQCLGAFAFYNFVNETAEFGRFMVEPSVQYNGVGSEILNLALNEAVKLGLRYLHLIVKEDNEVALRLYVRAGFHRRPSVDGVIPMWKALT